MGIHKSSIQKCSSRSRVSASLLLSFLALTNSTAAISNQVTQSMIIPQLPLIPEIGAHTTHDFVCRMGDDPHLTMLTAE
jgi:hypothetical protein